MKIEIELSEVERLRQQIKDLEQKVEYWHSEYQENTKHKWEERAKRLGWHLFESYLECTFKSLGFDPGGNGAYFWSSIEMANVQSQLGNLWFKQSDRIKMSVGAHITEQFRGAFLKIGVIPQEPEPQPEELKL